MFKFALNTCHKSFGIAKVLFKKKLEFFLENGNICIVIEFLTILILGLVEANVFPDKKGLK